MKAVRLNQWGTPVQLEDVPQPTPNEDEVLVRVRAVSVNPLDNAVVAGYLSFMLAVPLTMGVDFAGDVVAVGAEVKHVKPGDAVYGLIMFHHGTYAEYTIAKAYEVAPKPKSLSYVEAAAVSMTALAAIQTVVNHAQLEAGQRLLIHGVSGNVGYLALQFAKDKGLHVIGTSSAANADFVRGLGIDEHIDYKNQRFEDVVRDVDAVIDFAGGDTLERSFSVVKPGGRLVTITTQTLPEGKAEQFGIQGITTFAQPNLEDFAKIADLIDLGKVKVVIGRTFPLAEAQAALTMKQQRQIRDKIVLTVD